MNTFRYFLLGFESPMQVASFTADVHIELLNSVLTGYGKDITCISYLIGDNCSTNKPPP